MDATKVKYYLKEISLATGIDVKTLGSRRGALVKAGEIEVSKGKHDYTYDEVLKLIRPRRKPGEPRTEYVTALKRQLQTDGYTIKKGGD